MSDAKERCNDGGERNRALLMIALSRYYSNSNAIQRILPIINGTSRISLRMIDWFVTTYAKQTPVVLMNSQEQHINVHVSYRTQLKSFSKQRFDPFRRRERIDFAYDKNNKNQIIETTIGQLNFFKWVLQIRLLDHIEANLADIEEKMIGAARRGTDIVGGCASVEKVKAVTPSQTQSPSRAHCSHAHKGIIVTSTAPRVIRFDD